MSSARANVSESSKSRLTSNDDQSRHLVVASSRSAKKRDDSITNMLSVFAVVEHVGPRWL
jgi:hypothetical protein